MPNTKNPKPLTVRAFLTDALGVDPTKGLVDALYPTKGVNSLHLLDGVSVRFGGPGGQVGELTLSYGGTPKATLVAGRTSTIMLARTDIPAFVLDAPVVS